MIEASRRSFITGLAALVAAPAIVRAGSLMPVKTMIEPRRFYAIGDSITSPLPYYIDGLHFTEVGWTQMREHFNAYARANFHRFNDIAELRPHLPSVMVGI